MPKGYKKDGTPLTPPVPVQRKAKPMGPFRFALDVDSILRSQPKKTEYSEQAVRVKYASEVFLLTTMSNEFLGLFTDQELAIKAAAHFPRAKITQCRITQS